MAVVDTILRKPTLAKSPARQKHASAQGQSVLFKVFEKLEKANIRYCVLHGYEKFPKIVGSDIDCIVAGETSPGELASFFAIACKQEGWFLLKNNGRHIEIGAYEPGGSLQILNFDFETDCSTAGLVSFSGDEALAGRRRHGSIQVPAVAVEFNAYLLRCIIKQTLDRQRLSRLSRLFGLDPAGCRQLMSRFWTTAQADAIGMACDTAEVKDVINMMPGLRAHAVKRLLRHNPAKFLLHQIHAIAGRIEKLVQPRGLQIVFLGPDGAGKSSIIAALQPGMAGLFNGGQVRGFAPPLHRIIKRGPVKTDTPHALKARSRIVSLVRAAYWFLYDGLARIPVYWALCRNELVLYDRHFIDILVDPVRYRYGGPRWLLLLMSKLMLRPDLVILLDAPPQVLHARKPELTMSERERQRTAYLAVAGNRRDSHVVNADQPFETVLRQVEAIIMQQVMLRKR